MSFDGRSLYPNLPEAWDYVAISDIADVNKVSITKKNEPSSIQYIDISSVSNNQMEPPKKLNYSEGPSRARRIVRGGDILISTVRPNLRQYVYIKEASDNLVASTGFAVVSPHESGYGRYLYTVLTSTQFTEHLVRIADGAAYPAFNPREISDAVIPWPSAEDLQKINDFIESVDDKIELNRQINQTLEQIAQAIFKSWFVDFEPVKAKIEAKQNGQDPERAAMRAISGKTDEELDQLSPKQRQQLAAAAVLFPDELEDSELGEIPKGWAYGSLSEICVFNDERIDVVNLTVENYISTENMLEGKRGVTTATSLPTVKTVPYFTVGHILISNIRPYFMKIWLSQFEGGRSADVLGIKSVDSDSIEFLYNLLYQDTFFNYMMATSKGAKMPRGDKDAIMRWDVPLPNLDIRRAYSSSLKVFYNLIENNNQENRNLADIRDAVLPRLLSGEIDADVSVVDKEAVA